MMGGLCTTLHRLHHLFVLKMALCSFLCLGGVPLHSTCLDSFSHPVSIRSGGNDYRCVVYPRGAGLKGDRMPSSQKPRACGWTMSLASLLCTPSVA